MKTPEWFRVERLRIVTIATQGTEMTLVDAMRAGVELAQCVHELASRVTLGAGRPRSWKDD